MTNALTLKAARAERNLSQAQLSYISQISQTTISFIENGKVKPHQATKDKLERVLGYAIDWPRTFDQGRRRRIVMTN